MKKKSLFQSPIIFMLIKVSFRLCGDYHTSNSVLLDVLTGVQSLLFVVVRFVALLFRKLACWSDSNSRLIWIRLRFEFRLLTQVKSNHVLNYYLHQNVQSSAAQLECNLVEIKSRTTMSHTTKACSWLMFGHILRLFKRPQYVHNLSTICRQISSKWQSA